MLAELAQAVKEAAHQAKQERTKAATDALLQLEGMLSQLEAERDQASPRFWTARDSRRSTPSTAPDPEPTGVLPGARHRLDLQLNETGAGSDSFTDGCACPPRSDCQMTCWLARSTPGRSTPARAAPKCRSPEPNSSPS